MTAQHMGIIINDSSAHLVREVEEEPGGGRLGAVVRLDHLDRALREEVGGVGLPVVRLVGHAHRAPEQLRAVFDAAVLALLEVEVEAVPVEVVRPVVLRALVVPVERVEAPEGRQVRRLVAA